MKRLVLLLTVILSLSFFKTTFAQDKYSPWTASLSTNAVNNPVRKLPGEKGKFQTWNMDPAGFKLALSRHLKNKFSFETQIIKQNKIVEVIKILKKKDLLYEGTLEKPKGEDLRDWEPRSQLLFKSSNSFLLTATSVTS